MYLDFRYYAGGMRTYTTIGSEDLMYGRDLIIDRKSEIMKDSADRNGMQTC